MSQPYTTETIAELLSRITPEPWDAAMDCVTGPTCGEIFRHTAGYPDCGVDVEFAAAAPAIVRQLLSENERLKGEGAHTDDCAALSRVWKALGINSYTGKSVDEHVVELLAERDTARAELDQAKFDLRQAEGWIDDVTEREAAVCPEDVGFDEYVKSLRTELVEAQTWIKGLETQESGTTQCPLCGKSFPHNHDDEALDRGLGLAIQLSDVHSLHRAAAVVGRRLIETEHETKSHVLALVRKKAEEWDADAKAKGRAFSDKANTVRELEKEIGEL